jgi:hypothetical protein
MVSVFSGRSVATCSFVRRSIKGAVNFCRALSYRDPAPVNGIGVFLLKNHGCQTYPATETQLGIQVQMYCFITGVPLKGNTIGRFELAYGTGD